jgi:hypothetical protein
MTNALPDYTAKWIQHRKMRRWWFASIVLMIAYGPGFALIAKRPLYICWSVVFVFSVARATSLLAQWPCPRCGKPFGQRGPFSQHGGFYPVAGLAKKCGNCGIKEFAADPADFAAPALPQN